MQMKKSLQKEFSNFRIDLRILKNLLLSTLILGLGLNFGLSSNFSTYAETAIKFTNEKEDCSTIEKQLQMAKKASLTACQWIAELGAGSRDDANSGFGKIAAARFCDGNYVYITEYIPNLTATSHSNYKYMLLHPVKPGLEKDMSTVHKVFASDYHVPEQTNFAASLNEGKGCWFPYYWTKPGDTAPSEKISFAVRCTDKITKKPMIATAGVHAPHTLYKSLNPPECAGTDNKWPYK
ncbi:MAG: hypothetical protein HQK49_18780 [Oligoflexia bacterium]|nr:hypothetical protein [Oligoflexia bacterium]